MKLTSPLYHYVIAYNGKGDVNAGYNKYMHFSFPQVMEKQKIIKMYLEKIYHT